MANNLIEAVRERVQVNPDFKIMHEFSCGKRSFENLPSHILDYFNYYNLDIGNLETESRLLQNSSLKIETAKLTKILRSVINSSVGVERLFSRNKLLFTRMRRSMISETRRCNLMCSFNREITMNLSDKAILSEMRKIVKNIKI